MAKTEEAVSKAIASFFAHELVPLASKMKAEGRLFFPAKSDSNARSYYINREKGTMSPTDFESGGSESMGSFGDELSELWKSQGFEELVVLIPTLTRLARLLNNVEKQDDEVSPFVYVMY